MLQRYKSSLAGANRIQQVPFPEAELPTRRQLGLQQPTPGQSEGLKLTVIFIAVFITS